MHTNQKAMVDIKILDKLPDFENNEIQKCSLIV